MIYLVDTLTITLLYDKLCLTGFTGGWGLSIWIEYYNEVILFDTGWNGEILLANCKKANKNIKDITYIFLSHIHWDHVGGIVYLLNQDLPLLKGIIVPKSFSTHFKKELSSLAPVIEINDSKTPQEISSGIYSSGVLGSNIKEHALLLKSNSDQIFIVAGCSHPFPTEFMNSAKHIGTNFGIIGGFHGFRQIEALSELEIIIPIHCTKQQKQILERYKNSAFLMKVGETKKLKSFQLNQV